MERIVTDEPIANKGDTEVLAARVLRLYKRYLKTWNHVAPLPEEEDLNLENLYNPGLDVAAAKRSGGEGRGADEEFNERLKNLPSSNEAKKLSFFLADEMPLSTQHKYKWLACTSTQERLRLLLDALKYLLVFNGTEG